MPCHMRKREGGGRGQREEKQQGEGEGGGAWVKVGNNPPWVDGAPAISPRAD